MMKVIKKIAKIIVIIIDDIIEELRRPADTEPPVPVKPKEEER